MFAADHRSSTLSRAVGIARELAIAVVLSLVIVTTAGGVTDASMRISVVVAAIYLTAAEVHRQLPDLAAYAVAPFKRFLISLLEPILETIRLSIANAFQHSWMEPSRLNLPATPQIENIRERHPEEQYGHNDLSMIIRELTQLRIETERNAHLVLELLNSGQEWRYRNDEVATLVRDLTERTIAAEKQVQVLADRIDHLTAALDHSSNVVVGESRVEPINSTQETLNRLEYLQLFDLPVAFVGSAASLMNVRVVVDNLALWSTAKTHLERNLELLPRRYVISGPPTLYRKQFDTLQALRTDPAAFKRFIEELLERLAETGQR
jgi:hypothetical protein